MKRNCQKEFGFRFDERHKKERERGGSGERVERERQERERQERERQSERERQEREDFRLNRIQKEYIDDTIGQ